MQYKSVARTLAYMLSRTSKGDYCKEQCFSPIKSLVTMGPLFKRANSFLEEQSRIVWKFNASKIDYLP